MEIALGVLLLAAAALGVAFAISLYNGLGRVRGELRRAWGELDILLQQRHDELRALEAVDARLLADYDLAPTSGAKTDVENRLNRELRVTLREDLEKAIAERRRSFNRAVGVYNAYVKTFPFVVPHPRLEDQRAAEAQDAPPPKPLLIVLTPPVRQEPPVEGRETRKP